MKFWDLFVQLTVSDFKLRYKNSYLGFFWVIIKPLAMFSITYTVWTSIFAVPPAFKLELLLGLIIMLFFSELILMGLGSLLSKSHVILKVNFSKEVAVMSNTMIAVIDLIVNMVVFAVFMITDNVQISILGVLLFLTSIIALYVMCLGASLFTSILFIKVRDIRNIIELILQLLYWATPVYYSIDALPAGISTYIKMNPLTIILEAARKGLIFGVDVVGADFWAVIRILLISIVVLFIGLIFFKKSIYNVVEKF